MSTLHLAPLSPSYYTATAAPAPKRPVLTGDVRCDVCVIGAGITGLSAALHLARRGYKVAVLESHTVGWGASGRSGGQALIGYNTGFHDIAARVGRDDARKIWDLGVYAKDLLVDTVREHAIACDLKWGYLMLGIKPRHLNDLARYKDDLERVSGYEGLQLFDHVEARARIGSDTYIGGLSDPGSGHLHPLNYTQGLARAAEHAGAVVYESTPANHIQDGPTPRITTPGGTVTCDHLIVGANAYLGDLAPAMGRTILPTHSHIIATEPLGDDVARGLIRDDACAIDMNHVLNYWRLSADKRLLFGGHVGGGTNTADVKKTLGAAMCRVYPQLHDRAIDYAWGGQVAITRNLLPHFGRTGKAGKNVYFAQGFSGHGILLAGLAGKLMAEAVQGTAENFDLFTRIPHAPFPGGALLRTPTRVLSMLYFRLRDFL